MDQSLEDVAVYVLGETAFYGQSAAKPNLAVFDFVMFDHLTMGDRLLQREVIDLFRLQVEQLCHQTPHFRILPEFKGMAHTLRGSAAAVGAPEIVALAKIWEGALTLPDPNVWSSYRSRLNDLFKIYISEVDRVLPPPPMRR